MGGGICKRHRRRRTHGTRAGACAHRRWRRTGALALRVATAPLYCACAAQSTYNWPPQTLLQAAPDLQLTLTNVERTNLPRDYLMRAQNGAMAAMHLLAERPGHISALAALWLPLAFMLSESEMLSNFTARLLAHTLHGPGLACTAADSGTWPRGRAAVCCITPASPDSLRLHSSCVLCADRRGGPHRPEV